MKKTTCCLLFIHLLAFALCADWKSETRQYLTKAHDYDRLAHYLENNMAQIPSGEKSRAVVILGYAYNAIGDSVNEKKWLTRYFEEYDSGDFEIDFLPPETNVKIFEYHNRWLRTYPKLKSIALNDSSKKVCYFEPPATLFLDIHMRAPVELVIKNEKLEVIYTRYLHKGPNTIDLPFARHFKQKENRLYLLFRTGAIEINKTLMLHAEYKYPETIVFDSQTGDLSMAGQRFKQEKSEQVEYETKTHFDKKFFFKHALLPIGIGCAVTAFNMLLVEPRRDGENRSAGQRAFYDGAYKTTAVLSIGITLKGIVNIFRSFKKEKKRNVKTVINPVAAAFNLHLRQQIEAAKAEIFIIYRLELKD